MGKVFEGAVERAASKYAEIKAEHDAVEAMLISRNRIEITEWRVAFDDEDSLAVHVFAAGDTTDLGALIAAEQKDNYAEDADDPGIVWDDNDAKHCGTVINVAEIVDGEILTSHDGRRWLVTIEEYLGGPEVLQHGG